MAEVKGGSMTKVGLIICIVLVVILAVSSAGLFIGIVTLQSRIDSLNSQIDSLEEPELHEVEIYWEDNHPLYGLPYVHVLGSIFNSGSQTADSVVVTIRIYDAYHILLEGEDVQLGDIAGKSYKTFDVNISYSGYASEVTTQSAFG